MKNKNVSQNSSSDPHNNIVIYKYNIICCAKCAELANRNDTKILWPQEQKNIRRNDQTSLGPRGKRHYVYAYNIIHIYFFKTFRYFYHKICISRPNMIYIFAGRRWTLKCDYELRKVPRQRTPPEGGIYATDVYIEQGSQTFGNLLSVYVKILYNIILYNILCRQSCFLAHGSMVITITFNLKTKSTNLTRTWRIPKMCGSLIVTTLYKTYL